MARIEEYGFIGDTETAALVSREGSVDWLCLPHFDSAACFAALLGTSDHGRWLLSPATATTAPITRRYRPGTLILETEFTTAEGRVRITDCMPPRQQTPRVIRLVEGLEGRVPMRTELILRFDYGRIVPWVRRDDGILRAVAGPDAVALRTPIETHGEDLATIAEFPVAAGERVPFVLTWHPSHEAPPSVLDVDETIRATNDWWLAWSGRCAYDGPWRDQVITSLVVLKALTFAPTGGIVAAPTTSLPEWIGGSRNWDYRYCWLRDATFTLQALLVSGYHQEACAWRDWLLRAAAGDPSKLQVLYGPSGEPRLSEVTLDWLPGYERSAPVRIGNAASKQFQLDIYGEIIDVLHQTRREGLSDEWSWPVQKTLLTFLESNWNLPDEGIWEVRGPRQQFTHSKVLVWAAFDRAIKAIEGFGLSGPLDQWKATRARIHAEVCAQAIDAARGCFTQAYGSKQLDAALLMIPLVGFLPVTDPRVMATIAAIENDLLHEGLVRRYRTEHVEDGLPTGEGTFLACSFWLADTYAMLGRDDDARRLFEHLLSLRNDLGLLAEQYDPAAGRQLGNFPQAFSHVGLVNTAHNLTEGARGPARDRHTQ